MTPFQTAKIIPNNVLIISSKLKLLEQKVSDFCCFMSLEQKNISN